MKIKTFVNESDVTINEFMSSKEIAIKDVKVCVVDSDIVTMTKIIVLYEETKEIAKKMKKFEKSLLDSFESLKNEAKI